MRGVGFAFRGEIRDYCSAGLYLAFERPLSAEAVRALPPSSAVLVEFVAGERTHRVPAKVARARPTGIGLQVAALPGAVLDALRAAGDASSAPAPADDPGLTPEARHAIQQSCHREFGAAMNEVVKAFFDAVAEALIDGSDQVVGIALRGRFADAAREFAAGRAPIAGRFAESLRESLRDPVAERRPERPEAAPTELALVDDEQFEEWLSLSTVAHQIEADLNGALTELQRRYGALRGLPLDRSTNPFGPTSVCRAFQEAIAPMEHPMPVRAVAYRTFGAALHARCAALYVALNATLAPLDGPRAPVRAPQRPAAPVPVRPAGRDPSGRDPPDWGAQGGDRAPRAGADADDTRSAPMPAALAELVESLQGLYRPAPAAPVPATVDYSLERLMKSLGRDAPAVAAPHGSVPVAAAAPPGTAPAAAAPPAATALLGLIRGLGRGASVESRPDGAGSDTRLLEGLLDALPAEAGQRADPSGARTLSARLVEALHASPLPQQQRRSLESAAGLLGRALTESGADSEIHGLLRRLERPLLKLALRDASVLESAEHPARRMVDLLEQYAIATDEQGRFFDDALRRYLDQLVERVAAQGADDPALFGRARDVLARLLGPIRETRRLRVARLQEACEARDRIRRSRERVADALAARLGGREVPEPVLRLLDAGWRQHLVLLEMRGADADRDDALAVLDGLLERLGPGSEGGSQVRAGWSALLARIEAVLATVCVDPAAREACVEHLEGALAALERGEAPASAACHPPLDPAARDLSAALEARARQLRLGEWWLVPREGRLLPMQLIWTSRPAGACALANRSASDRHELSLAEFARQIDEGRIRPWSDQERPLLERSEFALLDEGRRALLERAVCDPVSGLANRKGFMQRLARLAPTADGAHTVGVVEFDSLRIIWSACGVDAGEALVRELAGAARACLGDAAALASLRDDTFALLLPDVDAAAAACGPLEALRTRLADHRFEHGGQRFSIGVSVGLARWAPAEIAPEEALRRADAACVAARSGGRNRVHVYDHGGLELRSHESTADWAGRIDGLLEGSGLYLRAQRISPIADPGLASYHEILLGIEPQPGLRAGPSEFVAAVERLGRSHELDLWVMRTALDWIESHREAFDALGGFSINLSPLSLAHPEVLGFLDERLARPGIPTDRLVFELTETAAIDSYGAARDFIRRVRRHGCRVALDDFGSGYASYAHLKNLSTDTLKIDGAFVRDMLASPGDRAMVRSMHEVARTLGMRTVAEYVESAEVLEALREIGVDYAQGYAIHRPCRLDELTA